MSATASSAGSEPRRGLALRCVKVSHIFDRDAEAVIVLNGVDLDVGAGELMAVLGPSGSGKSTLLAALAGLLRPTSGHVLVGDRDMAAMTPADLSRLRATELAVVLQDPSRNLLPYATALQNLVFAQRGARARGWPLRWQPAELIGELGLAKLGDEPVHRLSGGEQQRVCVARALATSPHVLLLDEPTSNLDPAGRDAVVDLVGRAHRLSGTTTVVVTHDPTVAAATDRTVTIRSGRVGAEGRAGQDYVVVNRDGSVQLPPDVVARFAPGSLLRLDRQGDRIELRLPADGPTAGGSEHRR